MLLAVFLMVLIPCAAISFVGANIGLSLRKTLLPEHHVNRIWNQSAIALVTAVFIANLAFQISVKRDAKSEEVSVVEFVKMSKEVQSIAGVIKTVSIHGIGTKKGSTTKVYDLYVVGDDTTVYPIVRVLRDSSSPQIVLACVSEVPSGHRDPYKDPCEQ